MYGFKRRRGYHTAIGKARIMIQMSVYRSHTIYQIYLDLRKAYDSIDRNRLIRILENTKSDIVSGTLYLRSRVKNNFS